MSEIGIGTHLIWFLISTYIDKGIAKVPTSSKIRAHVQGYTSKIRNLPTSAYYTYPDGETSHSAHTLCAVILRI